MSPAPPGRLAGVWGAANGSPLPFLIQSYCFGSAGGVSAGEPEFDGASDGGVVSDGVLVGGVSAGGEEAGGVSAGGVVAGGVVEDAGGVEGSVVVGVCAFCAHQK